MERIHFLSEIDAERRTAVCRHCGPVSIRPAGERWKCKVGSAEWDHVGGNRRRLHRDRARFRVEQGDRCAICGTSEAKLVWDHCHVTGEGRGLLCSACNTGLGMFTDSPAIMRAAIRYVQSQGQRQNRRRLR